MSMDSMINAYVHILFKSLDRINTGGCFLIPLRQKAASPIQMAKSSFELSDRKSSGQNVPLCNNKQQKHKPQDQDEKAVCVMRMVTTKESSQNFHIPNLSWKGIDNCSLYSGEMSVTALADTQQHAAVDQREWRSKGFRTGCQSSPKTSAQNLLSCVSATSCMCVRLQLSGFSWLCPFCVHMHAFWGLILERTLICFTANV